MDGFAALSDLDSNRDAILDNQDAGFDNLRIWRDLNQDARSSALELTSLAEANITSIDLNPSVSTQVVAGHDVSLASTFTQTNGGTRAIGDILLQVDPLNAEFSGEYQLSIQALMMPLIRGYGLVPHLHIAMSQDPALLSRVQDLVTQGMAGSSNLAEQVEQLIIHWTGSEDIVPDSRGQFVDARRLGALEAFMATPFVTNQGQTQPGFNHAVLVNQAWEELHTGVLERLVSQGLKGSPFTAASYEFSTDTVMVPGSLSDWIDSARNQQPYDSSDAIAYWRNFADLLRLNADTLGVTQEAVETSLATALTGTGLEAFSTTLSLSHLGGSAHPDTLQSGNQFDLITAGAGNDTLIAGGAGYRALFGGMGDDELIAQPLLTGITDFVGGTGRDTLIGSRYADGYFFNSGDGQDVIDETAGGFSGFADKLYFGSGITNDAVTLARDGLDLRFNIETTGDAITVTGWYDRAGANGADKRIESVIFDNTTWLVEDIHTRGLEVHGTPGDDTLNALPYQPDS